MTISEQKAVMRHELRRKRRELPDELRRELDEGIFRNVIRSQKFREADTLLMYISCGGEPDTYGILLEALRLKKQVAVPRCGKAGAMSFYLLRDRSELRPMAYGIPEPTGTEQPVLTEKTLCLVPGIAFTERGERLGQGGGYYDRFMQKYPQVYTAGLCYSFCMQKELPIEAHDICVQAVVTENCVTTKD
jgi:5-formyltetrahydrofolate cyclo-ligase